MTRKKAWKRRSPWLVLAAVAAAYGLFFSGRWLWRAWVRPVTLAAGKPGYYH